MREAVLGSGIIKLLPLDGKALAKTGCSTVQTHNLISSSFCVQIGTKALSVSGGVTKGGN